MYCGDETGSFIGDIGSYSARFGYGGNNVPSYVVPSMVMTQQQEQEQQPSSDTTTDNNHTARTIKIYKSTIPTSCYNYKYGHPLDNNNNSSIVYDYRVPMRRMSCVSSPSTPSSSSLSQSSSISSTSSISFRPITDPTLYLQQGDSIHDWDAYEQLWMNAIDTMSVTKTYQHTTKNSGNKPTTTTTINNNTNSTTIRSGSTTTTAMGDHQCSHPFLIVSPGMTHSMLPSSSSSVSVEPSATSGNNNDTTGTSTATSDSLSIMNRSKKELLQLTEFMMETLKVPAMYVAPTPMLSSFAHGRQTALIVDIGAGGTRVTPVVDGLLLKQSQRRSGRGTDWIQNCIWQALLVQQQQQGGRPSSSSSKSTFNLTPRYQIKQRRIDDALNHSSTATRQQPQSQPHGIFHRWAMNDLMYEIRTSEHIALPHWWYDPSVPFVYDDDNDDDDNGRMMTEENDDNGNDKEEETTTTTTGTTNNNAGGNLHYELPDGTRIDLSTRIGKDICRVPELFFSEMCPFQTTTSQPQQQLLLLSQHATLSNAPLHQLIHDSLSSVSDVDVRRELAATIVLTGGGSASLPNLASRLSLELSRITSSSYKPKVLATGYGTTISSIKNTSGGGGGSSAANNTTKSHQSTSIERQCSAWIGGSILTSLGSFQQLWLSKAEYDECGGTLAIQKFP